METSALYKYIIHLYAVLLNIRYLSKWFLCISPSKWHTSLVLFAFFSSLFNVLFKVAWCCNVRMDLCPYRSCRVISLLKVLPLERYVLSSFFQWMLFSCCLPEKLTNLTTMIHGHVKWSCLHIHKSSILQHRLQVVGKVNVHSTLIHNSNGYRCSVLVTLLSFFFTFSLNIPQSNVSCAFGPALTSLAYESYKICTIQNVSWSAVNTCFWINKVPRSTQSIHQASECAYGVQVSKLALH